MRSNVRVDIVSDVVCPWCMIGHAQLQKAATQVNVTLDVHWHPFELNPDMGPEGENLRDHMIRKYGITATQSQEARRRLEGLARDLAVAMQFSDDQRIYNTFDLHRLLHWAEQFQLATPLKLGLFQAYFGAGAALNDPDTIADIADLVGLDRVQAYRVLTGGTYAKETRARQYHWRARGITGVPAMVFAQKHIVVGAQGVDAYAQLLSQLLDATT